MRKRNYQRIITCMFLALLMIIESAFSLCSYATKNNVSMETNDKCLGTEENLEEIEDLLVCEGRKISEEELEESDNIEYDGYIIKVSDSAENKELKATDRMIRSAESEDENSQIETLKKESFYVADSLETISDYIPAELVDYIEPDVRCELMEVNGMTDEFRSEMSQSPNDPLFNDSRYAWAWNNPHVQDSWKYGLYGASDDGRPVTVAVIDSGLISNHPDINYDRIDSRGVTYCMGDTEEGCEDTMGHGTFVTGVINARMNNGKGIVGAMPALNVYPIRIFRNTPTGLTGGQISDVIRGINRAISIKADVINMSFGTGTRNQSLEAACSAAIDAGIILVASVGNKGSNVTSYPAGCKGVIGVASVSETSEKAPSSNYNSTVDCAAPGVSVMGLNIGYGGSEESYYRTGSGTSFAAPQVAALAGMAKSIDRRITTQEFEKLLARTCRDLGSPGKDDKYGYGLINFGLMAKTMLSERGITDSSEVTISDTIPEDMKSEKREEEKQIDLSESEIKVSEKNIKYTGKAIYPGVSVEYQGRTLREKTDYILEYSNNKTVGTASVTATGIGKYKGTITADFRITPKGSSIYSCGRLKRSLLIKWTKQKTRMNTRRISGYQVQIAKNPTFTKGKKSYCISGYGKTNKKITGLSRKTNYYTRIRTYMKVSDKTYYSGWSFIKVYKTK